MTDGRTATRSRYYAPQPRAVVEVVDFDDYDRIVGYGETGRVKLTTLTKEFFVPGFLERDEGEREPPYDKYPWDGVSGVRPFRRIGGGDDGGRLLKGMKKKKGTLIDAFRTNQINGDYGDQCSSFFRQIFYRTGG